MNTNKISNFDNLPDMAQLRLSEAAEITATSVSTIRRLIRDEKITAVKLSPQMLRVSAGSLRQFMSEREV